MQQEAFFKCEAKFPNFFNKTAVISEAIFSIFSEGRYRINWNGQGGECRNLLETHLEIV